MKKYLGFTDGSADNTGDRSGGWAFVIDFLGFRIISSGFEKDTTNNRMEILAVLKLLEYCDQYFQDSVSNILITSDSKYVINSITQWRFKWESNGWKTNSGPVANVDLWQAITPLADKLKPEFKWVKGHAGHEQNELCDTFAGTSRIQEIEVLRRIRR